MNISTLWEEMPVVIVNGCALANHWTGLDNGLDCWTGLLDWIAGLTFELNLFISDELKGYCKTCSHV